MAERIFPNWHEIYGQQPAERMPWYFGELDPDLETALSARRITAGRLLDLGTGPATQALALAERGFEVTATDVSAQAVERGRALAAEHGLRIEFLADDVLNSRLAGDFDIVFDRGCFHVFAPELRARYVQTLARLVRPQGLFFLKCFSDEQPGEIGPYQFHPSDIDRIFEDAFTVSAIVRTVYQGTLAQLPKALFCTLTRR